MTRGPYLLNAHAGCADCALAKTVEPGDAPWPFYTAGCDACGERMLATMREFPGVDIDAVHKRQETPT